MFPRMHTQHHVAWLPGTEETGPLLHDLAGLALSNKMILPVSSWVKTHLYIYFYTKILCCYVLEPILLAGQILIVLWSVVILWRWQTQELSCILCIVNMLAIQYRRTGLACYPTPVKSTWTHHRTMRSWTTCRSTSTTARRIRSSSADTATSPRTSSSKRIKSTKSATLPPPAADLSWECSARMRIWQRYGIAMFWLFSFSLLI